MKKILFTVILSFMCVTMNAQLVTSTTRKINRINTPSNILWIARGGLNFAGYSGDDADGLDKITGYYVGMEFQKPITSVDGLYWGAGLGLKTKGYKFEEKDDGDKYTEKMNLNALEIPVNIGYNYAFNSDVKAGIHAGVFANYDLWGKCKVEDSYFYDYNYEVKLKDFEDYSNFGLGLSFGVGVWYRQFNIDATFQFGLLEQFDEVKAKESNILLTVGYAF